MAVPSKVLVVVLENHGVNAAWDQMPYLRALGAHFGRATDYRGVTHPSLPNYLAIAGGSTFGVRDDDGPESHRLAGSSVFGQALSHGRTAKVYAEDMGRSCQTGSTGRYAVKHNPWAYFSDPVERAACGERDVPAGTPAAGALRTDTAQGRLPNVGLVIPDLCHDAHDCSLDAADRWLSRWVPVWQAGPDFRGGRLAVVVTFDEDDRSQGNRVLTVVVHPALRAVTVAAPESHLTLSAWLSVVAGAPALRDAAGRRSLGRAFGLASA